MSFFRDRSPVTPKITRAQGSGIRGSLRSCAVRSGLPTGSILPVLCVVHLPYCARQGPDARTALFARGPPYSAGPLAPDQAASLGRAAPAAAALSDLSTPSSSSFQLAS